MGPRAVDDGRGCVDRGGRRHLSPDQTSTCVTVECAAFGSLRRPASLPVRDDTPGLFLPPFRRGRRSHPGRDRGRRGVADARLGGAGGAGGARLGRGDRARRRRSSDPGRPPSRRASATAPSPRGRRRRWWGSACGCSPRSASRSRSSSRRRSPRAPSSRCGSRSATGAPRPRDRRAAAGGAAHAPGGRLRMSGRFLVLAARPDVARPPRTPVRRRRATPSRTTLVMLLVVGGPDAADRSRSRRARQGPRAERDAQPRRVGAAVPARAGRAARARTSATDRFIPFLWTVFFLILFANLLGDAADRPAIVPLITGRRRTSAAPRRATSRSRRGSRCARSSRSTSAASASRASGTTSRTSRRTCRGRCSGPARCRSRSSAALVKPFALAIRLFANMIAGHIVLAVLLGFTARARRRRRRR